ncbi:MAG: nucleotide exchange factor GrpE [Bacteroidales bacterium]
MARKTKNKKEEKKVAESKSKDLKPEEGSVKTTESKEKNEETSVPKKTVEEELQEKLDAANDKYIRLYSEFDNYRRRTIKERLELSKTASVDVIVDLLPVLDDFERAIKSSEESTDCEAVKEGVKLIYNKMKSGLEKKGLKPIEAIGSDFDTDFHEAITQIPAPSEKEKGKVIDEIERGYLLNDKVIRFSKVVIGQ